MPKILVYDGDCPMCWWITQRFVALGLLDDDRRRPFQAFEGERARALEQAGIRNEMLVLEPETGEIRAGVRGFSWLLEDTRYRLLGSLLGVVPVRAVLRLGYRIVAYNRRVLAPPPRGIVCDCDPDPHNGFRALFLAATAALALGSAAVLGVAIRHAFGVAGALPAVVLAVLLVSALLLLGRVTLVASAYRLVGNALVVVAVGLLAALPLAALALLLAGTLARASVGFAAVAAVVAAGRSLRWRLPRLGGGAGESPGD